MPVAAVLAAVKVRVLAPVVDAGLKFALTPAGNPLALRATALLNPPTEVTVTALVPVAPCVTVAFVAEREKSGFCAAVTVKLTLVLCVSVPLAPLMVTFVVPVAAVLEAVKVRLLVPAVDTGLKLTVTPAGRPLALRATLPENPPKGVTLTVLLALPP